MFEEEVSVWRGKGTLCRGPADEEKVCEPRVVMLLEIKEDQWWTWCRQVWVSRSWGEVWQGRAWRLGGGGGGVCTEMVVDFED